MNSGPKKIETEDLFLWILVIVPLFFLPISIDVFNFPKQWILVSLSLGALIHNQLFRITKVTPNPASSKLLFWALASLSLLVMASGLLTETTIIRALFGYPGRANGVLTFFAIIAVIWVGSTMVLTPVFQRKLFKRVIFLFSALGLYSVVQFLNLDPVKWDNSYNRIIGTFGNPNFSGAFLGVAASTTLYASLLVVGKKRIYLALFSVILLLLSLATESLQAGGVFGASIVILIMAFIFQRAQRWKFIIFSCLCFILSSLLAFSFLGFGPFGEKLYQYTLILRLNYWRIGLETAASFPWLGVGPDSYIEGFRLFRGEDFVARYSDQVRSDSAHNVLINFMANFGIPAFLIFAFVTFLISIKAARVIFLPSANPPIVRMVALVWILMLIQSLLSLEQIGLVVFQWCCGALLLNQNFVSLKEESSPERKLGNNNKKEPVLFHLRTELSILVVIFSLIASWPFLRQNIDLRTTAGTSVSNGVSDMSVIEEVNKFGDYVELEVARVLYLADYLLRAQRYEQAEEILERTLLNDPDGVEAMEQMARIAMFRSDYVKELRFRKMIEEKDPYNYENLLAIAQNLKSQKRLTEAKGYAQQTLRLSSDTTINETAKSILNS